MAKDNKDSKDKPEVQKSTSGLHTNPTPIKDKQKDSINKNAEEMVEGVKERAEQLKKPETFPQLSDQEVSTKKLHNGGKADLSNHHKEENDADTQLRVDEARDELDRNPITPVPRRQSKVNRDAKNVGGNQEFYIKAISGRTVTLVEDFDNEEEEGTKIYLAKQAQVTLNGEVTTLANLDNGDKVVVGGGKNSRIGAFEYHNITATREEE